MPKRYCSAANCEGTDRHLYKWPAGALGELWTKFVRTKRVGKDGKPWKPNTNSYLCFRHFTPDMFENYEQYIRQPDENIV